MTEEKDKGHLARVDILGDTMPNQSLTPFLVGPGLCLAASEDVGCQVFTVTCFSGWHSSFCPCGALAFSSCRPAPSSPGRSGKTKLLHSTGAVLFPTVLISSRGSSLLLCTTQSTDPSIQLSKQNREENLVCF